MTSRDRKSRAGLVVMPSRFLSALRPASSEYKMAAEVPARTPRFKSTLAHYSHSLWPCPVEGSCMSVFLHGCLRAHWGCGLLWSGMVSTANFLLVQVQRPRGPFESWTIVSFCWPSWGLLSKYRKPPTRLLPVGSKCELPQPKTVSRNKSLSPKSLIVHFICS